MWIANFKVHMHVLKAPSVLVFQHVPNHMDHNQRKFNLHGGGINKVYTLIYNNLCSVLNLYHIKVLNIVFYFIYTLLFHQLHLFIFS